MATKVQHDFFQKLFDDETKRTADLESRARTYLTVISIFAGALALKFQDVHASAEKLGAPTWPFAVVGALIMLSLGACLWGLQIRTFEAPNDPNKLIDNLGATPPKDEDFYDERILDYTVATERNSAANDGIARALLVSGLLLFGAVAGLCAVMAYVVLRG